MVWWNEVSRISFIVIFLWSWRLLGQLYVDRWMMETLLSLGSKFCMVGCCLHNLRQASCRMNFGFVNRQICLRQLWSRFNHRVRTAVMPHPEVALDDGFVQRNSNFVDMLVFTDKLRRLGEFLWRIDKASFLMFLRQSHKLVRSVLPKVGPRKCFC